MVEAMEYPGVVIAIQYGEIDVRTTMQGTRFRCQVSGRIAEVFVKLLVLFRTTRLLRPIPADSMRKLTVNSCKQEPMFFLFFFTRPSSAWA